MRWRVACWCGRRMSSGVALALAKKREAAWVSAQPWQAALIEACGWAKKRCNNSRPRWSRRLSPRHSDCNSWSIQVIGRNRYGRKVMGRELIELLYTSRAAGAGDARPPLSQGQQARRLMCKRQLRRAVLPHPSIQEGRTTQSQSGKNRPGVAAESAGRLVGRRVHGLVGGAHG